jgi:hypothetical protein
MGMGLTGCMIGGGPFVAFDKHGMTGGVEGAAGGAAVAPQAVVGYEASPEVIYVRADVPYNLTGLKPTEGFGGRIGGGIRFNRDSEYLGGMFVAGANSARVLYDLSDACGSANPVGSLELQVRYVGEWQAVLAARIELVGTPCIKLVGP